MEWIDFIFCALLGWTGVHKFKERKLVMGTLYFTTVGLCGVGWLVDTVRYLIIAIRRTIELYRAQSKRLMPGGAWTIINEPELLELRIGESCYYEQNGARISPKAVNGNDEEETLIVFEKTMPASVGRRRRKRINWRKADELLGRIYVTDQRIAVTDGQEITECEISAIRAVNLYRNMMLIKWSGGRIYLATDEAACIYEMIARIFREQCSSIC